MNLSAKSRIAKEEEAPGLHRALTLLRHENRAYTQRAYGCGVCWILSVFLFLTWIARSVFDSATSIFVLITSLLCLILGAVLIPSSNSPALKLLEELQDIRAVPGLVSAIENSFGAKAQALRSLLTQLLPQLTSADAGLLNRSHLAVLRRELELEQYNTTLEYSLAIVSALSHIGNQETAQRLQELIKRGAITERQQFIRQAAEQSLPILEARLAREQVSGTLLRASEASPNTTELLHPAISPPDTDGETLLQPAHRPAE